MPIPSEETRKLLRLDEQLLEQISMPSILPVERFLTIPTHTTTLKMSFEPCSLCGKVFECFHSTGESAK